MLILRAVRGDHVALGLLLQSHHSRLTAYVDRHLPSDVRQFIEPQDVVQDVHFEAFRRIGTFRPLGRDAFLRWTLTIARNRIFEVIRVARTAKRGGGRQIDNAFRSPVDEASVVALLTDMKVYSRTPSESVLSRELVSSLNRCLDRLVPEHREVLRLRYVEGLPAAQVGQQMGRSDGAVHMLCGRALEALRSEMLRVGDGPLA